MAEIRKAKRRGTFNLGDGPRDYLSFTVPIEFKTEFEQYCLDHRISKVECLVRAFESLRRQPEFEPQG